MDQTRLRHVVLLGFKDGTTEEELDEIIRRFASLAGVVPGIEGFEWGANNSPEDINHGHTHCFTLTFADEAARDAYLPHPKHQEFVAFAKQWLEKVLVFDYWAQTVP